MIQLSSYLRHWSTVSLVCACIVVTEQQNHRVEALASLIAKEPVSQLLMIHADDIATLKGVCASKIGDDAASEEPYSNDVFYLRYCLASDNISEQTTRLEGNLDWRAGMGKSICDGATKALAKAASAGSWDNSPVLKAAPHSEIISKYLMPSNVITTTSSNNDLVYCIRAGQIDDVGLMGSISHEQMVDFFLYAKEVNAQVANTRSLASDQVQCLVTANDLAGVKLVGGSADFRRALSASSNQANELYPSTNGPTLLLNLPKLLSALVKLFTPLFSPEVKARLKFERGPLADVSDLTEVAASSSGLARTTFVKQLDDILYA